LIAVSNFDGLFIIKEQITIDVEESVVVETPVLTLSPNPASSTLRLKGNFNDSDIVIFDISGREALRLNSIPAVNGLNIDISSLTDGVYVVNVIDSQSGVMNATEKLVVAPN